MKNYMEAVKKEGVGRTAQLCHDALVEMLKELFEGKKYSGQEGRKPLQFFQQDLPIPENDDEDVDTDIANSPYIVVRMTGGSIKDDDSPQTVEFSLIICTYDNGKNQIGRAHV